MRKKSNSELARREREVIDILYRIGQASAKDIMAEMDEPPSYSGVRALLATMTEKGLIHQRKGARRYLYRPTVSENQAKRSALEQVMTTFFQGSPEKLVASLLDPCEQRLSQDEIADIRRLIQPSESKNSLQT